LDPYQKKSYLQVKVYTNGPAFTWNSKFMRVKDEASKYPQQNKDYVYYWKMETNSSDKKVYSYHLKNISDKSIKFYDFTLTNNGGSYYLVDNLLMNPVFTEPGDNFQIVKYTYESGETPSVNWYADWASFYSSESGTDFCSGLNKVLEASRDAFSSIKGEIKESANDTDVFFDTFYSKEHIDGVNNEVIEDFLFFYQYTGNIGSIASQDIIDKRFYGYKSKIESCLPNFEERARDEDDEPDNLKIEYEAEVDYQTHYLRLEVKYDYATDSYKLELVVEETY
jgi:hypothetical protein